MVNGKLTLSGFKGFEEVFTELPQSSFLPFVTLELVMNQLHGSIKFKNSELGKALWEVIKKHPFWLDLYETLIVSDSARKLNLEDDVRKFTFFIKHDWHLFNLQKLASFDSSEVTKFEKSSFNEKMQALLLLGYADYFESSRFVISDKFKSLKISDKENFFNLNVHDLILTITGKDVGKPNEKYAPQYAGTFKLNHSDPERALYSLKVAATEHMLFKEDPLTFIAEPGKGEEEELLKWQVSTLPFQITNALLAHLATTGEFSEDLKNGSGSEKIKWLEAKYAANDFDLDELTEVFRALTKYGRIFLIRQDGVKSKHYADLLKRMNQASR